MQDAFEILRLERRPFLDRDSVENRVRELQSANPPPIGLDPVAVNESARLLLDTALRLRHLIELETGTPSAAKITPALPETVSNLFQPVGTNLQNAALILKKLQAAASPIVRAGLSAESFLAAEELENLLHQIHETEAVLQNELLDADRLWIGPREDRHALLERLRSLQHAFAFIEKWSAQVREQLFQLMDSASSL